MGSKRQLSWSELGSWGDTLLVIQFIWSVDLFLAFRQIVFRSLDRNWTILPKRLMVSSVFSSWYAKWSRSTLKMPGMEHMICHRVSGSRIRARGCHITRCASSLSALFKLFYSKPCVRQFAFTSAKEVWLGPFEMLEGLAMARWKRCSLSCACKQIRFWFYLNLWYWKRSFDSCGPSDPGHA